MVNNEKLRLEIFVDNLTKPQLLALYQFFKNWEPLCNNGASRAISYFVDGDGNLHPNISMCIPDEITTEELQLAKNCYKNKKYIDFDDIAWELREIHDAGR